MSFYLIVGFVQDKVITQYWAIDLSYYFIYVF